MDFELRCPGGYRVDDVQNDNPDVNIILENGEVYVATFFTIENVKYLMHKEDAEQKGVFWASDMIILENLQKDTIRSAVRFLVDNYLEKACTKIGTNSPNSSWGEILNAD